MVGPFMQGMLLMSIIYWYSKGMMSMINDYYRSEFQRKLKDGSAPNSVENSYIDADAIVRQNLLKAQQHKEQLYKQMSPVTKGMQAKMETAANDATADKTTMPSILVESHLQLKPPKTSTTNTITITTATTTTSTCVNESRLQQFRRLLAQVVNICFWLDAGGAMLIK